MFRIIVPGAVCDLCWRYYWRDYCLHLGVGAKQTNKPDLKLTASIDTTVLEPQPMLVVHIINQSGHTLRIPDPPLLCKPAPGALSLQLKFIPENSKENEGQPECDIEVAGGGLPDIRERAKNWLVLKPGQDYAARRPLAMALNTSAGGTYRMWVIYDGPAANAEGLQKLKEAGIVVPNVRFQSDKVTYKVTLPKQ
jgi:hypothetical protein